MDWNVTAWHNQKNDAYLLIAWLTMISIFGTIGNIIVLRLYPWKQKYSKNSGLFIKLLTLVDLITCITIPYSVLFEMNIIQNNIACKILECLRHFLVAMSLLVMVSCAIERYMAICKPFHILTLRQTRLIILVIFSVSLVNVAPIAIFATTDARNFTVPKYFKMATDPCYMDTSSTGALIYGGWLFICFAGAELTMIILYTFIFIRLKAQWKQVSQFQI